MTDPNRSVLYMAHPLGGDVDGNIKRALRWLAWLRRSFPETTFVAPWIAGVMSVGGDGTEADREAGLVDDCATVALLDGIVLAGGRISSGMARERVAAITAGREVIDLTHLGDEPPLEMLVGERRFWLRKLDAEPAITTAPAPDDEWIDKGGPL